MRKSPSTITGTLGSPGGVLALSVIAGLIAANGLFLAEQTPTPWRIAGAVLLAIVAGAGIILGMEHIPRRLERAGFSPRLTAAIPPVSLGVGVCLGMMSSSIIAGATFMTVLFRWGWLLAFVLGVALIAAGRRRRVGGSLHCPKCEYEFGFASEADAPIRCPECGAGWLGLLVRGRRTGSVPMIVTGALLIAGVTLAFFAVLTGRAGGAARHLPTPLLISWAKATDYTGGPAWTTLAARRLTPEQTLNLAEHLVDKHERSGRRGYRRRPLLEACDWFEPQLGTGVFPPELEQRYYRQTFEHRGLAAPERIRVGEPFTVGLRGTRSSDGFAYKCFLAFAGFGVGDGPAEWGRSSELHYPNLSDFEDSSRYRAPSATIVLDEPGRATLRAVLWVVILSGPRPPVTWNDDGTPNLPPGALFAERIVIEQPIEVFE